MRDLVAAQDEMQSLSTSPLARTVIETPTDIWNDSCTVDELGYAVAFGAVGATANPTIVVDNWRKDPARWSERTRALATEHVAWNERDLAWAIVAEMSVLAAPLLRPAFEASGGRAGRLSVQTDPTLFRDPAAMVEQAVGFHALAPNIIVKFPTTTAGLAAMEEATYRGISVNATVSFSVAQALAAAEAVQRGIERREADGLSTGAMGPVITIMMGRVEDWLRLLVEREGIIIDPAALPWSGVAVLKRAYAAWQGRGFRARLLGAAIRHQLHWTELIGGDVVITMPSSWQKRFNASSVEVRPRIDEPVPYVDELRARFPDFVRAYEPDGLPPAMFDQWAPTVRTLRAFIASYHDVLHVVSDALLPDPDKGC